jgi:hypothetical protein
MTVGDKTIQRGDSDNFTIEISHNGVPLDLTGWTVWFTVRKEWVNQNIVDDEDALISRKITKFDTIGQVPIRITPEETTVKAGEYHYDIQYKQPNGTIKSSDPYKYTIKNDITRGS